MGFGAGAGAVGWDGLVVDVVDCWMGEGLVGVRSFWATNGFGIGGGLRREGRTTTHGMGPALRMGSPRG